MPKFDTTRETKFTPEQMYDLVADVEKYPIFLPLCKTLVVNKRFEDCNKTYLTAEMSVAYQMFRESFNCRVTLDRPNLIIDVEYIDGPFKYLENKWHFKPSNEGSTIVFHIDYEFRSRMLGAVMGAVFDKAFRTFANAFERRANRVYGITA
jgi:coenzyme Q-binding protein COQ10